LIFRGWSSINYKTFFSDFALKAFLVADWKISDNHFFRLKTSFALQHKYPDTFFSSINRCFHLIAKTRKE
jgi:hypothetical protein